MNWYKNAQMADPSFIDMQLSAMQTQTQQAMTQLPLLQSKLQSIPEDAPESSQAKSAVSKEITLLNKQIQTLQQQITYWQNMKSKKA